jgi:hypothetical protein
MTSSQKRPVFDEHGIWRWNGARWDLVKSKFRDGEPPFDPNEGGGIKIRGDRVGQYLVFPLEIVIGSGQNPHRMVVALADLTQSVDYCVCECQEGEWVPVENYCQSGCAPVCGFSDDPIDPTCNDGDLELGSCDCDD